MINEHSQICNLFAFYCEYPICSQAPMVHILVFFKKRNLFSFTPIKLEFDLNYLLPPSFRRPLIFKPPIFRVRVSLRKLLHESSFLISGIKLIQKQILLQTKLITLLIYPLNPNYLQHEHRHEHYEYECMNNKEKSSTRFCTSIVP